MWEAINNGMAPSAFGNIAQGNPKDQVANRGKPVPTDRIDQQGNVWNGIRGLGGGKWGLGHFEARQRVRTTFNVQRTYQDTTEL